MAKSVRMGKMTRCKTGRRRNKKTGNCHVKSTTKKNCPKGSRRQKNGSCKAKRAQYYL